MLKSNSSSYINPLNPNSDWLIIPPYSVTLESNIKAMRIKETITNVEALTILPDNTIEIAKRTVWRICKQYGDSIDSMENM